MAYTTGSKESSDGCHTWDAKNPGIGLVMRLGASVLPIWNIPGKQVVFSPFESMMKLILILAKDAQVSVIE